MAEQQFYRIVEKRGRQFVVDLDGKPLQPQDAIKLGHGLVTTAQDKSYVYIGTRESDGLYKLGRTVNTDRRQTELGVTFVHTIECDLYGDYSNVQIEHFFHQYYKDDRIEGELKLHNMKPY